MTDISLHIEYLLRYHDCVILPGVGAFLRAYRDAGMNPVTGELIPAASQICFNASITNDDALVANSISRREGVSFTEARTMLADATRDMLLALDADRELCFARIGTLALDEDDVMSFEPARALVSDGSFMPATSPLPELAPAEEKKTSDYYTFRISRKVVRGAMRYAAMLALIIISCVTLSDPGAGRHSAVPMRTDHASVIPLPKETPAPADTLPEQEIMPMR